jgi:EAL domain-containing protein (putative c-di-GMP-specific phosphodiesterase class I)
MAPPLRSREAMRLDLDHAIRSRSLTLAWQPYVEASSGHTVGYEALLRWNRPGYGDTSPAVFVPEAEASGLIGDLDAYVLRAACLAGAGWHGTWRVNVNVSSYWFALGRVADLVAQVLTETGLPGERLLIEITERTCIDCADTARLQIDALRKLGVRIALDDFGTGYSSLATISDLPIDEVKLDRSLIMRLDQNPKAGIVLRSVLDLARALSIEVCAEGIETPAQRQAVADAGCDYIQGFLIGRPGPLPDGT